MVLNPRHNGHAELFEANAEKILGDYIGQAWVQGGGAGTVVRYEDNRFEVVRVQSWGNGVMPSVLVVRRLV